MIRTARRTPDARLIASARIGDAEIIIEDVSSYGHAFPFYVHCTGTDRTMATHTYCATEADARAAANREWSFVKRSTR